MAHYHIRLQLAVTHWHSIVSRWLTLTPLYPTLTHSRTHTDTYMAYINEDSVQDITKVDGYRQNSNFSPTHLHPHRHTYTRTTKAAVSKSTQNKMTNKSALTSTNMLTSRSGYTDTTLRAASTKNFNEERHAVTLESNTRAGDFVCVCVCVFVCAWWPTDQGCPWGRSRSWQGPRRGPLG